MKQAIDGLLTMTDRMESLIDSIYMDRVPDFWAKLAFPSTRGLNSWLDNIGMRLKQLNMWKDKPTSIPKVVFLNRLFNPQSFLTAIKQVYAQEYQQELNKLYIQTEISKKAIEAMEASTSKDKMAGQAYVYGFHLEGARFDVNTGFIEESYPKQLYCRVPIVLCKTGILKEERGQPEKNLYQCPVYKTKNRGNTYVFPAQLKTKVNPQKWILAGVAVILDVEGVGDVLVPQTD